MKRRCAQTRARLTPPAPRRPFTAECLVQHLHDRQAVRHEVAVDLDRRQEAVGHLVEEPARLVAVAPHVDLVDPVRYPLLLQQQPHLLAVRTPRGSVAEQRHAHLALGLGSEESQAGVGVRRAEPLCLQRPLLSQHFSSRGRSDRGLQLRPRGGRVGWQRDGCAAGSLPAEEIREAHCSSRAERRRRPKDTRPTDDRGEHWKRKESYVRVEREAAQVVKALETCDGEGSAPSWSDVLDRFVEYSREVNGVCTSDPNMTEHTFEEGRTKTNIRVEGRARTLYLGGRKPAEDSGTHLGLGGAAPETPLSPNLPFIRLSGNSFGNLHVLPISLAGNFPGNLLVLPLFLSK